jgi:hypothetical protein
VEASRGAEEEDDVENGEEDEEVEEASVTSEDTVEPEYDKANSLSFALVCKRMEQLWQLKPKKGRTVSDWKILFFLPKEDKHHIISKIVFVVPLTNGNLNRHSIIAIELVLSIHSSKLSAPALSTMRKRLIKRFGSIQTDF